MERPREVFVEAASPAPKPKAAAAPEAAKTEKTEKVPA
jgi:NADH:ubiquinone reductase (H+-translocating)